MATPAADKVIKYHFLLVEERGVWERVTHLHIPVIIVTHTHTGVKTTRAQLES